MTNLIKRFSNDESGVTAIEYGLIAGLISIAILATLLLLGPKLDGTFVKILNALPTP